MKTLRVLRLTITASLLACASLLHAADTIEFTADSFEIHETSEWAPIQIKRTGGPFNFRAGVCVIVEGGTAQEGTDFVLERSFLETEIGAEFYPPLQPIDDGLPEPDETIVLRLADPTNGLQLGPRTRPP